MLFFITLIPIFSLKTKDVNLPTPQSPPRVVAGIWETAYNDKAVNLIQPAPPLFVGNEIVDLLDGEHFDAILQDATDDVRTASAIVFWDSFDEQCSALYAEKFYPVLKNRKKELPPREDVLVALYDMGAAPKRAWYEFTPERDLAARFGVQDCPSLVFVPRKCTGWTKWCVREEVEGEVGKVWTLGCDDFEEVCSDWIIYDEEKDVVQKSWASNLLGGAKNGWQGWVQRQVDKDGTPTRHNQRARDWLMPRQRRTETTFVRNAFMPPAGIRFTPRGFHAIEIPEDMYKMMTDYWDKWQNTIYTESWDSRSNTVINFHEVETKMVSLDKDMQFRNKIAIQYLKPLCEQWSGLRLHFESFYGIREYYTGHWLRSHIDRLDTHVISITMNLNPKDSDEHWPLEVITADGQKYQYEHPPGTMVFYESTVVIHGRPYAFPDKFHRGAFVHFAPRDWKQTIPQKMRSYQQQFLTRDMPNGESKQLVDGKEFLKNQRSKRETKRLRNLDINQPFEVLFHNFCKETLTVFWQDHTGKMTELGKLAPQEVFQQTTYHGHVFPIFREGEKIETIVVKHDQDEYIIKESQKEGL